MQFKSSVILIIVSLFWLPTQPAVAQSAAETLVLFDAAALETPESIVFDRHDNAYISLALTGEIRKITPDLVQTTIAFMPIGAPCGPIPTLAAGLAMDRHDELYVAVSACDPANSGLWHVDTDDGTIELLSNAPSGTVLNGIDIYRGFIYAADTFDGLVWRAPLSGGPLELWVDDPLLKIAPGSPFPGPNGLRFFRRRIYVANSSTGNIIAIPVRRGGNPGQPFVHATLPTPQGCDEFAFDVRGSIYCTTDPFNTIVRLDRNGDTEILLTAADLLDGPTSVAFGRRGHNRRNLYITNAAFPFFTTTFRPSLMVLPLNIPGAPF